MASTPVERTPRAAKTLAAPCRTIARTTSSPSCTPDAPRCFRAILADSILYVYYKIPGNEARSCILAPGARCTHPALGLARRVGHHVHVDGDRAHVRRAHQVAPLRDLRRGGGGARRPPARALNPDARGGPPDTLPHALAQRPGH